MLWYSWLIIAGVFFILETITVGFLVFWFAIGALIAMIASFFTVNLTIQTSIFLVSSTILLFATRPFVNKITKKDETVKTNVHSIEGKVAKVIKDIEPNEGLGQIKLNGEVWSARSYNDTFISKDSEVMVEKIDGVKAVVKPLKV